MSDLNTEARKRAEAVRASYNPGIQQGRELDARCLADDVLRLLAALEQAERALKELSGYVRAHLAGNDADPELKWALDLAEEALASPPGAAPDLLTRDEKVSLRSAVGCLREDYPHAAGLPHAESALRKLRATQADTDKP